MEEQKQKITVQASVTASIEKVWEYWTKPEHIIHWNFASPEWHSPAAENDLRENGRFSYRMEAKEGGIGFDFEGTYDRVKPHQRIDYTLGDDRKVTVMFRKEGEKTSVEEIFEAEDSHSIEMQKTGWQAILDNFKFYVENN
ncbi:SRPBCC family protein [Antarcticibacterium sp. 1MA-6-2]|uniref:SRPBCC family protein n=1 Tax=Antarcticibacterium sp. 1MA-6-2 TaxID=2908210 RepID=UPI001F404840|nr:SRPBCC family protein [Antarcticibacterium sp. 1MA-6-2]UJH92344.1 SRPBCC family protein [Antarcticibacterium sp. 1MA-6-2]